MEGINWLYLVPEEQQSMPRTRTGIEYTVRESSRAKRVIIKVWASSQVEVVVPKGFDRTRLPEILKLRAEWITDKRKNFREMKRKLRPKTINLKAVGQVWRIRYIDEGSGKLSIQEGPESILTVSGQVDDAGLVARALNSWLHQKARSILGEWLVTLSHELSLSFNRMTIRRQKTLWGSCSRKGNINLNRNLLFLSGKMARYVLVHELCHLEHPDHSTRFWDLVERYVRGSREMSSKTRRAGVAVPEWATV